MEYPEVGIVINFNKNENASNYYLVTFVSIVSLNFRFSLSSVIFDIQLILNCPLGKKQSA